MILKVFLAGTEGAFMPTSRGFLVNAAVLQKSVRKSWKQL